MGRYIPYPSKKRTSKEFTYCAKRGLGKLRSFGKIFKDFQKKI